MAVPRPPGGVRVVTSPGLNQQSIEAAAAISPTPWYLLARQPDRGRHDNSLGVIHSRGEPQQSTYCHHFRSITVPARLYCAARADAGQRTAYLGSRPAQPHRPFHCRAARARSGCIYASRLLLPSLHRRRVRRRRSCSLLDGFGDAPTRGHHVIHVDRIEGSRQLRDGQDALEVLLILA